MNINLVLLIIISSSTLIFGAIRLARFNAYSEQSNNSYYIGLPTPANAILICSLVLYMFNMPFNDLTELMSFFNSDITQFVCANESLLPRVPTKNVNVSPPLGIIHMHQVSF